MSQFGRTQIVFGTVISILFLIFFIALQELNPDLLIRMSGEDGFTENTTAVLFGLSCICFFIFAYRSEFLKGKSAAIYSMTISWGLLMFIFVGEEISWGQRIFDLTTPDALLEINLQKEINIHNIEFVDTFMGGKFRYLSIMMLMTGLLIPLFALSAFGKRTIQRFAFPVAPLCYAPLFVGAYIYGKYYFPQIANHAIEVRECLMAIGMFCFAATGAMFPCTLFRDCDSSS